jgi:P27 family predicted phage terminase small subunit
LISGNPGKRPLPQGEPIPVGALREPPDWFSESQKAGWRYAIEHAPFGLLKRLDRSALVAWAVAEDAHRQAAEKVQQHGMLVKTAQGTPIQSPYVGIMNRQANIMLRAIAQLGFSPSSRAGVSTLAPGSRTNAFEQNGRRPDPAG